MPHMKLLMLRVLICFSLLLAWNVDAVRQPTPAQAPITGDSTTGPSTDRITSYHQTSRSRLALLRCLLYWAGLDCPRLDSLLLPGQVLGSDSYDPA